MMPHVWPDLIENLHGSKYRHIPVILLTAKSDEESKVIGTEIGADAFLGKPFNHAEILSVVRNLLSPRAASAKQALNHQLTEHVLKRYLPPDIVIEDIIQGEFEFSVELTSASLPSSLATSVALHSWEKSSDRPLRSPAQ